MRRYIQIFGLMVLAFVAGGWGSMLAASLCPHMNAQPAARARKGAATDDASCHAEPEVVSGPDCHGSSAEQAERANSYAYTVPVDACAHCVSRPESPVSTAIARTQAEQKRSFEQPLSEALAVQAPARSFTARVIYRQGAPPGSPTPKHLLIGLLLI